MKKIIVGVLLLAVLFVGVSVAQEAIYCAGYSQGVLDGYASTWGPPPTDWSIDILSEPCAINANDPFGMEPFGVRRFTVGNYFDKVVDALGGIVDEVRSRF